MVASKMEGEVPFPARQMFVLALCRICEPIAFMSIFPYIYYMVESFNITSDERQITTYAGMVTAAFAFAEFGAGVFWGKLSDRFGRKPILLMGLFGTGLSMLLFGFATSLPVALLARALGGLLNGNIGVLQTTVREVITVKAHEPRGYSIMPFVWCLGSIIGSSVGGTLAQPVKNYPSIFGAGTLFDRFPYLLPNIVCTCVVVFGLIVGVLFLEETHEDRKDNRDVGLELGQSILAFVWGRPRQAVTLDSELPEEAVSFLAKHEQLQAYQSAGSTPRSSSESLCVDSHLTEKRAPTWRDAFTKRVMLNIAAYGILALHTISFEQLMPVLLSMAESTTTPSLPFKFVGGLSMSTKDIGVVLSIQGIFQMVAQLVIFPFVVRRLGSLWTFRCILLTYPFLYFVTPYLALVNGLLRMPMVYSILAWKVTAGSLAMPSLQMMLAESAPSKRVLGTVNGAGASAASLCRGIGPIAAGVIQMFGLSHGYSGLSWWAFAAVAVLGAAESWLMRVPKREEALSEKEDLIDAVCEAPLTDEERGR